MSERLPVLVDPKALAQREATFAGKLAVGRMERLCSLLVHPFEDVSVEIRFTNESNFSFIRGQIKGRLFIECQRCLEPLKFPIDHQIQLGIVTTESEVNEIPGAGEPLLVDGNPLKLIEIIEDELLLLLPMHAMHETGQCSKNLVKEPVAQDVAKKKSPFEVLGRMKIK